MGVDETARPRVERSRAREEIVISLLLAGRSVAEICAAVPIARTSLWRLRSSAGFQQRFREARRQALESAVNALHDNALVFVQTLRDVCTDPEARGSEKATAARSGLDSLLKSVGLFDIEERMRRLEQAAGEDKR